MWQNNGREEFCKLSISKVEGQPKSNLKVLAEESERIFLSLQDFHFNPGNCNMNRSLYNFSKNHLRQVSQVVELS